MKRMADCRRNGVSHTVRSWDGFGLAYPLQCCEQLTSTCVDQERNGEVVLALMTEFVSQLFWDVVINVLIFIWLLDL